MLVHIHLSTQFCQTTLRCPRALTPARATSKRQPWARPWTKSDKAPQKCHGHQRPEVPDESHQSPQQSEPWWVVGPVSISSTSGAESSAQGGAGGAASATPRHPPAAEPQVPWGLEFMIIAATAFTFGGIVVFGAAAWLLQQLFPGMALGRMLALTALLGSLAQVLLAGCLVKVIRDDWEPPQLGSFPLGFKPLAQWIPQIMQISMAIVLTALFCSILSNILPPGPVADHHTEVARKQAALLGLMLGKGDWVAGVLFFLGACVCAPVTEEIMFRGFILPSLLRYVPAWAAVLASAAIFSGAHLSFIHVRLVLGLVLGAMFLQARN